MSPGNGRELGPHRDIVVIGTLPEGWRRSAKSLVPSRLTFPRPCSSS